MIINPLLPIEFPAAEILPICASGLFRFSVASLVVPGLYFLSEGGRLSYIGCSRSCLLRIIQHRDQHKIIFDSAIVLPMRWPGVGDAEQKELLFDAEFEVLQVACPPGNKPIPLWTRKNGDSYLASHPMKKLYEKGLIIPRRPGRRRPCVGPMVCLWDGGAFVASDEVPGTWVAFDGDSARGYSRAFGSLANFFGRDAGLTYRFVSAPHPGVPGPDIPAKRRYSRRVGH